MSESLKLKTALERFSKRLAYKELDRQALDISRACAAGNLGEDKDYSNWAMISDDPLVMINLVKTYITTLNSKLTGAPFRPENDKLYQIGIAYQFNAVFSEAYNDVLSDGYSFIGVGMSNGIPQIRPIDARYIMFNGEEPTLRDATDVAVFEILPLPDDEEERLKYIGQTFLTSYVTFDTQRERVKVSHYHKDSKTGEFVLDVYDQDYENPTSYPLPGLDRIPVVRFVGDKIELSDKRYHYRGIYYAMASVLKALAVASTKINIRTVSSDDDNYVADKAFTAGCKGWENSGVKEANYKDANGLDIPKLDFIPHDNDFLLHAFETWKNIISDMLGPTVASGSEAVTREEVIARNEVKDAISNEYLTRVAVSIGEVYRIIQMFNGDGAKKVVILGGYIESVKRQKDMAELDKVYSYAKEAGLNTQGIVIQMLDRTDLPAEMKLKLSASFKEDPYKSPLVVQLQQQIQQGQQTIQQLQQQIALLRIQATQRLERQSEYIASNERIQRLKLATDQWKEEQKQSQEARMAVLNDCLAKGDMEGAFAVLEGIAHEEPSLLANPALQQLANMFYEQNASSVANALNESGAIGAQPVQPPPQPVQPQNVNAKGTVAPLPAQHQLRGAATLFTDA